MIGGVMNGQINNKHSSDMFAGFRRKVFRKIKCNACNKFFELRAKNDRKCEECKNIEFSFMIHDLGYNKSHKRN